MGGVWRVFQVGELDTWLGGFINISGMYKKGCRSGVPYAYEVT